MGLVDKMKKDSLLITRVFCTILGVNRVQLKLPSCELLAHVSGALKEESLMNG